MMKMSPFSLLPALPLDSGVARLGSRVRGNDGPFAGMTAEGAGMAIPGAGMMNPAAGMTRWELVQGGEGPLLKLRKAIASKTSLSSRNEGG